MSDRPRPDGYDALPKRFKDYIRELEQVIHDLRALVPSSEPTSIHLARPGSDERTYLPDGTRVEFAVGHERLQVCLSRNRRIQGLEVTSINGMLAVLPEVANVVVLVPEKDLR